MEETLKQPECFRDREESIQRLPQLVFAALEACRRWGGDLQRSKAAFPKAIEARCDLCGFVLSGEELLALADIFRVNEESKMLKRLRAGHCARDGCVSTHYHLLFYNVPELSWPAIFAELRPKDLWFSQKEIRTAERHVSPDFLGAIRHAARNIRRIAEQQLPRQWSLEVEPGGTC